jgi:cytidyltransferase-like protein
LVTRGKEKASETPREALDILREVYVEDIRDGRATVVDVVRNQNVSATAARAALKDASEKKLVKMTDGVVELTPEGRRRLKVVMVGGAFEIIHPGHVNALTEARSIGNTLVVVVATDESVEKNKVRPPVTDQASRVDLVSSLRQVDLALPGNKGSIYDILLRVRPDVVALGYDQKHSGDEIVREAARRGVATTVVRLGALTPNFKTSKILSSM